MTGQRFDLEELGWTEFFASAFDALGERDLVPARVGIEYNYLYRVCASQGELLAESAGRLRHQVSGPEELPAVGDWVAVRVSETERKATIRAVLPRRSRFSRKAAGDPTKQQVVAANIDVVLLVTGLDDNFNPRRIERYLVAASESGATPVVLLNKADLRDDVDACVDRVRSLAARVPIHVTSCVAGSGLATLDRYLVVGRTVALLGSSGAGKSTIINRLLGHERQRTHAVRTDDSRGRHTTIHRELIVVPTGGVIIDTPGMRELQIWDTERALEETFDDIDALAADCQFRDCQHSGQPRCAVQRAIDDGRLPATRLEHYHRLHDERASLDRRLDERAQLKYKRQTKVVHRAARKMYKERPR